MVYLKILNIKHAMPSKSYCFIALWTQFINSCVSLHVAPVTPNGDALKKSVSALRTLNMPKLSNVPVTVCT